LARPHVNISGIGSKTKEADVPAGAEVLVDVELTEERGEVMMGRDRKERRTAR
jgi:hypothetical protein